MTFCSPTFLIACGILAVLNQLCPVRWGRRMLLGGASLAFLAAIAPRVSSMIAYAVIILASYAAIWLTARRPVRGWMAACVGGSVVLFVFVKHYSFLDLFLYLPDPAIYLKTIRRLSVFDVVGLSYMLFKGIHALVDVRQGQLKPGSLLCYANYQLSFFTIVAGPIQRYGDFCAFWDEPDARPADPRATWDAWSRILTGLFKAGGLAGIVGWICSVPGTGPAASEEFWPAFARYFYGYPIWLYFNFSGYTDVMIGAAQLLGLRLPENFNYPFLARSVIDFWNRWHISLSHWIRDYIFMTSYKAIVERWPGAAKRMGYLLLFVSLFVAGLWHGSTLGYAVFGAIHGLGAMTNEAWGAGIKAWLGRPGFKSYLNSGVVRGLAILTTFHYVCFSFLFFSLGYGGAAALVRRLAGEFAALPVATIAAGLAAALLGVAAVAVALDFGYRRLEGQGWISAWAARSQRLRDAAATRFCVVSAKTVLVTLMFLIIWGLAQKEPVVLYQGF